MTTLLSPAQAAEQIGVSIRRVQRHAEPSGCAIRVGRAIVIPADKLDELRRYIAAGKERQREAVTGNAFSPGRPRKKSEKSK